MKYRAEIDGLRALAVIPVILFHAGLDLFSGGFIGVDVFFVISGYLITSILIEDIENKRFSILNFYERRARRILPALFFVMLVCIPFAWLWILPIQMKDFSQSLVAVSFFASNFLFWIESGYFAAASEEKPLLHTWSLAVEEQFYLLFPIFLLFAWRFGKNKTFWMIIILIALSFILSQWALRHDAMANFYFAPTRAWELLAGSVTAFLVQKQGVQSNNSLSLLGLGAIIYPVFMYNYQTPYPSVYAIVPVLGTCLLILFAGKNTLTAKLLSMKLLVGIGLISYSAYLWHQPLFAFAKIRMIEHPSFIQLLTLMIVSILLAWFSWKFIETPFRNKKKINRKKIFFFSVSFSVLFIAFGLIGHTSGGYKNRFPDLQTIYDSATVTNPNFENCFLTFNRNSDLAHPLNNCTDFFINDSASVIMIGDSHLNSIDYELQRELFNIGIGSYSVSYSGCISFPGFYIATYERKNSQCNDYNESMLQYARNNNIDTIILVSRFSIYLLGSPYDNGEDGIEHGPPNPVDVMESFPKLSEWNDPMRIERVADNYKKSLNSLLEEFNVILFEPTPEVGWDVVKRYLKLKRFSDHSNLPITHSFDAYKQRNELFLNILDQLHHENLYRVNVADIFCNDENERCITEHNGKLLYRDDDHLSQYGAKLVTRKFMRNLPDPLIKLAQNNQLIKENE